MASSVEDRAGYAGLALAPAPEVAGSSPPGGPGPQGRGRLAAFVLTLVGLGLALAAVRGGGAREARIEARDLLRADDERHRPQAPTSSTSSTAGPGQGDAAEHTLEMGAAAFATHWFGQDDPTTTTTRPASAEPADPTHGWYRVYIKTIVRRAVALDSPQVAVIPAGVFVHAAERRGRRIRVDLAGSDLSQTQGVAGWLSVETADGSITILRPIDPEELPESGPEGLGHGSLTELLTKRKEAMLRKQKYDRQAQKVAKMTVYQRAITQDLQKVDPNKTAKSIAYFGRHREEVEEKGMQSAERAGEHALDSLEKGANAVLGKLDNVASGLTGAEHSNDGTPVKPISIGLKGDAVKGVFGFLKKELG